jgi:hypothetical protein
VDADGLVKFYSDPYFLKLVTDKTEKFHIAQWKAPDFDATLSGRWYVQSDLCQAKYMRKSMIMRSPWVLGTSMVAAWSRPRNEVLARAFRYGQLLFRI